MTNFFKKGKLPRLQKHRYMGQAVIFWTNTIEKRSRGWLTPLFHSKFREILIHASVRENLICPAYYLMPDHLHLVLMGMRRDCNQLTAMSFLRARIEPLLDENRKWQHQPHDHVLRPEERRRNAFAKFCFYTLANPIRAELAKRENDWSYSGALVPGYPDLNPFDTGYWKLFWKLYEKGRNTESPPEGSPPLIQPLVCRSCGPNDMDRSNKGFFKITEASRHTFAINQSPPRYLGGYIDALCFS